MNPVDSQINPKQINPKEVLTTLGYVKTSKLQRVRGGWATLLWQFKTPDGLEHVLRIYHQPAGYEEEIAWRERTALEACAKAGLPVPRIERVGKVEGFPALVLSWCPGSTLMSLIEREPWFVWRWGRLLGETQARVHAVRPPPQFLTKAPDDWIHRVTNRYTDLADYLLSLKPSTDSLIHMDFHPLNIIIKDANITGIIDWTGAAAGDPRADLARTEVTILTTPIPPSPIKPLLNFARKIFLRGWRYGYAKIAGFVPDYCPFRAWAAATFLWELELFAFKFDTWAKEEEIKGFCKTLHQLIDSLAEDIR
jgi:aminoglycoside phosphotransferase (APT) family kinase protein